MVDIPVRQRQGVPTWVWFAVGVVALLIVLALIDYFVTNLVLNRGPGAAPGRPDDPFTTLLSEYRLFGSVLLLSFTRRL